MQELVKFIAAITSKLYMIRGQFLLHELSSVWCLCVPSFISYGLSVLVKLMKMFVYIKSLSRNLKLLAVVGNELKINDVQNSGEEPVN